MLGEPSSRSSPYRETDRMTEPTSGTPRRRRFLAPALLAIVAIGALGSATAGATEVEPAPMVLQNVSLEDIVANKKGICNGGFTHVMKNAAGPTNAKNYLNASQKCGLKVIFFFPETVRHDLGRVYPSKVAYWV